MADRLMKSAGLTDRAKLVLWTCLITSAVSGCTQVEDFLRGRRTADASEQVILGAPGAESYLQELQQLATGDPYVQVEIHADAESAATLTPNPSTQLRYALVLATPGHASADPEKAASLLREILAQTEMMTVNEVALATVYLKNVDERLVLSAEARRLRSESATAASAEQRATSRRIQQIEAENLRLREQLADTEQKLEALTSIERSIRAQDNTDN